MHNTKYRTKFCSQIDMRINGVHWNNEMTGINGPTGIFELITAVMIISEINAWKQEKFVCCV